VLKLRDSETKFRRLVNPPCGQPPRLVSQVSVSLKLVERQARTGMSPSVS